VCGVIMHAGLAIDRAPRQSLYVDRSLVQAAITAPNDRFLGDRRDSLIETQDRRARPIDPVADAAAYERASAGDDLVLVSAEWSPAVMGRVSRFRVELRNAGATAAYLDLRYATRYRDAAGTEVATRQGVIKEILQPGSARAWADLTDGMVPAGAVSATLSLESAEKCIPARGATPKPDNAAFPDTGCQALSTPNTGLSSCQWLLERTSRPRDGKGHWAEQARGRPAAIARGYGAVVVGQRVVDQDVDPFQTDKELGQFDFRLVCVSHLELEGLSAAARLPDQLQRFRRRLIVGFVGDHHLVSMRGQLDGNGPADPADAARHDGDLLLTHALSSRLCFRWFMAIVL